MPRLANDAWKAARDMWESGASTEQVARDLGVAVTTVLGHKEKEGWLRAAPTQPKYEPLTDLDALTPTQTVGSAVMAQFGEDEKYEMPVTPDLDYQRRVTEMAQRLQQLEMENTRLAEEVEEYRPTMPYRMPSTVDEVVDVLGEEFIQNVVENRLSDINRQRMRAGAFPIDWRTEPAIFDKTKREVVADVLSVRTRFSEENFLRTVKMWHKGRVVQVPHEIHFNNEAGQEGAVIWKMRDKGAKLVVPYICMRNNCWLEAAVHPDGSFIFDGYCSAAHRSTDPYMGAQIEGVSRRLKHRPNATQLEFGRRR